MSEFKIHCSRYNDIVSTLFMMVDYYYSDKVYIAGNGQVIKGLLIGRDGHLDQSEAYDIS